MIVTHRGRSHSERTDPSMHAPTRTERLSVKLGGRSARRDRSVCAMFAWISTPDIGPSGVGWMSRLSVNVAPTNTIFPLNGLSLSGWTPLFAAAWMATLGKVVIDPAGPTYSTRHGVFTKLGAVAGPLSSVPASAAAAVR